MDFSVGEVYRLQTIKFQWVFQHWGWEENCFTFLSNGILPNVYVIAPRIVPVKNDGDNYL